MAKRLINNPSDFVEEMLQGILALHPGVARLEGVNALVRSDYEQVKATQVALLSGGGSGHEPAHAGYIGAGMLSAVAPGGVFASPGVAQILSALRVVTGPPGCLLIVKNYTGDRINFGLAAEQARAEGYNVRMVVVGEDCALDEGGTAGRRGLAGTAFVHKIAGAAAAAGCTLDEVTAQAEHVARSIGTMGVGLSVCTLPGKPTPDRLGPNEMELGLGIHGEPGVRKCEVQPVDQIVDQLVTTIAKSKEEGGSGYLSLSSGDSVCLMVANLGSVPYSELFIVARRAIQQCEAAGISVIRSTVGTFMPALDMNGMSITLLKASGPGADVMLQRLDAPTAAPYWPSRMSVPRECPPAVPKGKFAAPEQSALQYASIPQEAADAIKALVLSVCAALVAAEAKLSEWDGAVGDGDCGDTFRRGADAVAAACQSNYVFTKPAQLLTQIADTIASVMGATSGVMLDIFFRAAGAALHKRLGSDAAAVTAADWVEAFAVGVERVQFYGGARPGMRTMLDALVPALEAARAQAEAGASGTEVLNQAAGAALKGAEATQGMEAMAGRASYVRKEQMAKAPDPGAMAIAYAVQALTK
eukprot:CAMPEP_0174323884 /NCGR_PEP_ID=MMETSP0810-20121108/12115_1 /TAXON_ID=73025 ORGANISM="Eutreptiella gymnastica-like, Strain CCMP1594" /NCGR_SAMPLE_ID=MMETSP0810 /ASSEMBLY_ACC=CAM_ASM_000659 /LENGTH=586 /DNA_ID=CAMNT_0015436481 /DNA_START=28 /DNA_END=1788 /DNA_ORIENTATION=+